MKNYTFESEQFALSNDAFHFLRSRYNYKTIVNEDIRSVAIYKGKAINNWLFMLSVGVALILISIYMIVNIVPAIVDGSTGRGYYTLSVPFFMILGGISAVVVSLKSRIVVKINYSKGSKKFRIMDHQLNQLLEVLSMGQLYDKVNPPILITNDIIKPGPFRAE